MIANIESLSEEISESDRGVCARCKGAVDGQLTKITDIKSQIISRAKLSISKHLREANQRENLRMRQGDDFIPSAAPVREGASLFSVGNSALPGL